MSARFTFDERLTYKAMPGVEMATLPDGLPAGTECFIYTNRRNQLCAAFFSGKSSKAVWHYAFYSRTQIQERIDNTVRNLLSWEESKKTRREVRKTAVHPFKVGDILSGSWGYDQTNAEVFVVVRLEGKHIVIRECALVTVPGSEGFMSETVTAGEAVGPELKKLPIPSADGKSWHVKLHESCSLYPSTKDAKHYSSWYA